VIDDAHRHDSAPTQEAAMSATGVPSPNRDAATGMVDMHLEVRIIPVSGVDRAKQFCQRLGWRLDDDVAPLEGLRIVQFTPPGKPKIDWDDPQAEDVLVSAES
jgi:hypothetical protein